LEKQKCAASAQGDWPIRKRILLREQSQPRHKDLNAGIWIRAVRRAPMSFSPTGNKCKPKLFTGAAAGIVCNSII
jgi:hypothetical protein